MTRRHNSQVGFTLIEVMMAISILALLTVVIAVSWRIAASAQSKVGAELLRSRGVEASADLIEKQIASIVPVRDPNVTGEETVFFQGSADAVRFVSRYSLREKSRAGLTLVEYRIERGETGARLLSWEMPVRALSDLQGTAWQWSAADGRELPLDSEAAAYSFSYLLVDTPSQARLAAAEWRGQGGVLPVGVTLQATRNGVSAPAREWAFRLHTRDTVRRAPFNPALPYQ
jgi:prepilin-type N-terminal cleavage/methylation domain-containing protein